MAFWMLLWKVVLIAGLVLFAGMAVWVTIGGFGDIKKLFKRIRQSHHQQEKSEKD